MSKPKKSIAEKEAKAKSLKTPKVEKPAKEKKEKKKVKVVAETPASVAKPNARKPIAVKKVAAEKPAKVVAPAIELTVEEISLRAYFIAERRQAMGWSGDSTQDWVEAERQLKAEAKRKAQKK